jgi:hypothetical protein
MPRPKKSKSLLDGEKHSIEFTPARLILSMCALIIFGLVCFSLGIAVNKLDSARERAMARNTVTSDAQTPGDPAGRQLTPNQVEQAGDSKPPATSASTATPPTRDNVRVVDLPTVSPAVSDQKATATAPPSPPRDPIAAVDVAKVEEPTKAPASPPPAAGSDAAQTPSDASPKPSSSAAAPPSSPKEAATGDYRVQMLATVSKEMAQAETFKELLEKQLGEKAELVVGDDGWVRVFVGRFPTLDKAQEKQTELRKIAQFKECWARKYP